MSGEVGRFFIASMLPCLQAAPTKRNRGGSMKKLVVVIGMVALAGLAHADQNVNGYIRQDGTYVQGYTRSTPDSSYNNNYSTSGNINPYTGSSGGNSQTYNDRSPNYNQGHYGNSNTFSNPYGNYGGKQRSNSRRGW
jgi:hypothetical protein